MPDFAAALKAEIARVAKKELKGEVIALRKAIGRHRSEIAALKRALEDQKKALRQLERTRAATPAREPAGQGVGTLRFSASRLAAQRARLGLSAREFGLLIGASTQSVYNWEAGTVRPGEAALAAIAALRKAGKRQVQARLAELG
jgi:DNA-binding transcriptional regulator YiaG